MSKTILNTNAIYGQVDQSKTSNNKITYLGDYHTFAEIDTTKFSNEVLVWHTPEFSKEEWRYGLYGINIKPTWDYVEEEGMITIEIQKQYFLVYDDGTHTTYLENLLNSVKIFGKQFEIIIFKKESLDKNFVHKHSDILNLPRGGGYWLWKPYIINETLKKIKDNDLVFYLDLKYYFIEDFTELYYDYMKEHDILIWKNHPNDNTFLMKKYCKMDVILKYNMYEPIIKNNLEDYWAGAIIIKNNNFTKDIISQWLNMCCIYEDITDTDSINPNIEEFIEHRHDQSLLSIVLYKNNIISYIFPKKYLYNCRTFSNLNFKESKLKNIELLGCFISIPKCASKTVLEMFKLGHNRDNHFDEKSSQVIIYENHQRLKILERKYNLKNKYIFTFVRHPYDRIKSWYYYHKKIEPYKSKSLNEWINNGCQTHWTIQNETVWNDETLSPLLQYNFIDGKSNINYIGKIENFEQDCKIIISELNELYKKYNYSTRISYKFIKINQSDKKNNDIISKKNKDLIFQMFKKDFTFFNYAK